MKCGDKINLSNYVYFLKLLKKWNKKLISNMSVLICKFIILQSKLHINIFYITQRKRWNHICLMSVNCLPLKYNFFFLYRRQNLFEKEDNNFFSEKIITCGNVYRTLVVIIWIYICMINNLWLHFIFLTIQTTVYIMFYLKSDGREITHQF